VRGLVEILVGKVSGRGVVRDDVGFLVLLLLLLVLLACRAEGARSLANQTLVLAAS